MFGILQKLARAAANAPRLHSIAAVMRGRSFAGSFDLGDISYSFSFSPGKAAVVGRRLQLGGSLIVIDGRSNSSVAPHSVYVRATLASAQGGIGTAPPRKKLPPDILAPNPDLPVVESTGALSFCGVLYFKLSHVEGSALGVPADMRSLQLNVRLAPTVESERALQAVYSSIVEALFGSQVNAAAEHVTELNKLLVAG